MAQHREEQTRQHEPETGSARKRSGPGQPAGKPERPTPEKKIPQGPPGKSPDTRDSPREFDL